MSLLLLTIVLINSISLTLQIPMSITYCEGGVQINKTSEDCNVGFNFGTKKPDCICINGVYRLWMSNCAIYDGFMSSGCTTLTHESHEVVGIRLANGQIDAMNSSTVAIFGLKETDYQKWYTFNIGQTSYSLTDKFYTLNGLAFYNFYDKSICVQKYDRPKFCRYFRGDQSTIWGDDNGRVKISVMENCPTNGERLIEKACYDILSDNDSDCSLNCYDPSALSDTFINSQENEESINYDYDKNDPDCFKNIHNSTNNFLNRKLNQYAKLRQVKLAVKPSHRLLKPIRTFAILDIMKQIAKRTCPPSYVKSNYIEQAVDLFIVLHKGQDYRYVEDLSEANFEWIRKILLECSLNAKSIELFAQETQPGCDESEKVKGVCIPYDSNNNNNSCTKTPIHLESLNHDGSFRFHYVIDTVWNILDLVQITCFPYFEESYRMFHRWEQSLEKLFTREIKKLWFNPGISTVRVYQNILAPTAETDMFNLEMCVESAYALNPSLTRLLRPTSPKTLFRRKKRNVEENYEALDVTCLKNEKDFIYPC